MRNFVGAKKLAQIKEIIELWKVELQRVSCISNHSLGLTLDTFHFHENRLVTFLPYAPGFGCSNQQHNFLLSVA